jgi:hypothetical protein
LGNERVSNSTSEHSTPVFIAVRLSQGVRPVADMIEIGYHNVVTAEIWGAQATSLSVSAASRNEL